MITMAELCAGYGGLHLATHLAGWPTRLAWVAETDPDASCVLAARYGVTNVGDIATADWSKVERVDILAAGYPCQPYSNAGQRKGNDDHRAIWPAVANAIRALGPRLVLLENVAAHTQRGFSGVVGDLATLGYDATWTCLRASDVGAPHQRDRLFVVATDPDREPVRLEHEPVGARQPAPVAGGDRPGSLMPTPTANLGRGAGLPTESAASRYMTGRRMLDDAVALLPTPRASEGAKSGPNQRGSSGDLTLTSSVMLLPTPTSTNSHGNATNNRGNLLLPGAVADTERWGQYAPAIERWASIIGRPAPDPTIIGKRGGRRLSAQFVEWLMGLHTGHVTDLVDNTPALRILGNGVVPQQGAAAYSTLIGGEHTC